MKIKNKIVTFLLCFTAAFMFACGTTPPPAPKPAERVISCYYNVTSTLIALGAKEKVVGIEIKADTRGIYRKAAPEFLDLPKVGSGSGINIEECLKLNPDLVILPEQLRESKTNFTQLNIPTLVASSEDIPSFFETVELLGEATGTADRANQLIGYYKDKLKMLESLEFKTRPVVYLSGGAQFLRTCTSKMFQHTLIELAGGKSASGDLTDGYWANISSEQLITWNPDVILRVNYATYSLDSIKNDPQLQPLKAVKDGRVYSIPSPLEAWDYATPSAILGVLWTLSILHPDLYSAEDLIADARDFYKTFFDVDVSAEEMEL